MGQVRYINILTWLRGVQDKLLYLVLFSLYPSLFWELRDKRNLKIYNFLSESLGAMLEYQICLTPPLGEVKAVKPLWISCNWPFCKIGRVTGRKLSLQYVLATFSQGIEYNPACRTIFFSGICFQKKTACQMNTSLFCIGFVFAFQTCVWWWHRRVQGHHAQQKISELQGYKSEWWNTVQLT